MLTLKDFSQIRDILNSGISAKTSKSYLLDYNVYLISKDFLLEKGEEEMAEAMQYLFDNNKKPNLRDKKIYEFVEFGPQECALPSLFLSLVRHNFYFHYDFGKLILSFSSIWKAFRDVIVITKDMSC